MLPALTSTLDIVSIQLSAGATFDRWTEEKDNTELEQNCLFKVDEYGFFIYWKSEGRLQKVLTLDVDRLPSANITYNLLVTLPYILDNAFLKIFTSLVCRQDRQLNKATQSKHICFIYHQKQKTKPNLITWKH
ncbi:hypothetical protein SFRURICE_006650 [Spodoptera frugiperda]|nr:hypothetical protein SFRURICE_006650 [Spodoptera frugiperda]